MLLVLQEKLFFKIQPMVKLTCNDYGFECPFVVEDGHIEEVVKKFGAHSDDVHGIDYQKEAIMQFIKRKQNK